MKNRVGDVVPSQAEVETLIADIEAINKRIERFTVVLTTEERTGNLRMRVGGENIVGALAQLADEHEVALAQVTVDAMIADLTLAQRLRPLAEAARQLSRRLDDTILTAQGECWWAATAFYTTLARVVAVNPTLEAAIRPIVDFFARGKRKKPANDTTPEGSL